MQASKLPDMTSNRELKIRFLLFLAYKIPDLISCPVTLRAEWLWTWYISLKRYNKDNKLFKIPNHDIDTLKNQFIYINFTFDFLDL
jgi:hypothetical protein